MLHLTRYSKGESLPFSFRPLTLGCLLLHFRTPKQEHSESKDGVNTDVFLKIICDHYILYGNLNWHLFGKKPDVTLNQYWHLFSMQCSLLSQKN